MESQRVSSGTSEMGEPSALKSKERLGLKYQGARGKFEKILDSSLLNRISYSPVVVSLSGGGGLEGKFIRLQIRKRDQPEEG